MENSLIIINLKGKLEKPFYFVKLSDAPYLTCSLVNWNTMCMWFWVAEELVSSNCDNRSQQQVEAIYGSFNFNSPTRISWKTSNRKWSNCGKIVVTLNDSWNKTSTFRAHVHSLDRRSGNAHASFIINSYYTIIKYKIVVKKDKWIQCF